jgi:hypothetical protein
MGRSFADKIADLETERATLMLELEYAPAEKRRMLNARLASLERSLKWYKARHAPKTKGRTPPTNV